MDKSSDYWIEKAYNYADVHPSVRSVTKPELGEDGLYRFIAEFLINLPGRYDLIGKTDKGIMKVEPVLFVFADTFPYRAPKIFLRDDFNREFPHINPSIKCVSPCIYEGNLDELLQQPKWFDGILDQVTDWLEKAAEENLMNAEQGWEPMRMDDVDGFIFYSSEDLINSLGFSSALLNSYVLYNRVKENIFGVVVNRDAKLSFEEQEGTMALIYSTEYKSTCDKYIPNFIESFSDLCSVARLFKIKDFRNKIDQEVVPLLKKYKKSIIFIILAVRRPINLINKSSNIELLNFAVNVRYNKKNGKMHLKSKVYSLGHHERCSPTLLRKFSDSKEANKIAIAQLGCGSLGSKLVIHLARNGNNNFFLVDNKYFHPHNNARHGLVNVGIFNKKTELIKETLAKMGIAVKQTYEDVCEAVADIKQKALYIDSTASLSVRNLLSQAELTGPVVNTSLYNKGRLALLAAEAPDRNPRIDDLIALLYSECLRDKQLAQQFLSEQAVFMSTGQGCGSYTTIMPDSRISLSAAGIASKIQCYLSNDTPDEGELLLGLVENNDMGITWKKIDSGKVIIIPARGEEDWEVRLQPKVLLEMEVCSKEDIPNETGGALIGCISLINKTITVTDLIPAPEDSIKTPAYFKLGTQGLKKRVMEIERNTNGLLTYLGTWHSHPFGGVASSLDGDTKMKLLILRDYEPTVCLIWTPGGIIRV